MTRWKGRPPRLSEAECQEIRRVVDERRKYPSNRELAEQYGVTRDLILRISSKRMPKRYENRRTG